MKKTPSIAIKKTKKLFDMYEGGTYNERCVLKKKENKNIHGNLTLYHTTCVKEKK